MDFGRNDLKPEKLSPDAVIQLAFQVMVVTLFGEQLFPFFV